MARFTNSLNLNCYRLNNSSQRYDKQTSGMINRDMKRMYQMMQTYILYCQYPIAVFTFLCKFVRNYNSINFHEGEAMWFLPNLTSD